MSMENTEVDSTFAAQVEAIVRQIPKGRVMAYGQIAALCGNARAARIVGGVAHFGDPELPWQRVVNKSGGLAAGYPGGRAAHREHLANEGIEVSEDYRVNVGALLWSPVEPDQRQPLIVVAGETASGKSALALQLAKDFDGELICADSWTVYKGFDIGTAKPDAAEQRQIPHHLLDIADPAVGFSVVEFQRQAQTVIADISQRGKLPIMVGGTGLYIDSVLYDYQFLPAPSAADRQVLNGLPLEKIVNKAQAMGLDTAGIDMRNKRRVIRLIENNGLRPTKGPLRPGTVVVGIAATDRDSLRQRITQRVDVMMAAGLEAEVQHLAELYGWAAEPMKGIGYREWQAYFKPESSDGSGQIQTMEQTRQRIISGTMNLAKRQRTWFKRNECIQWVSGKTTQTTHRDAVDIVTSFLAMSQFEQPMNKL